MARLKAQPTQQSHVLTEAQLTTLIQRYRRPIKCEGDVGDCLKRWRQAEQDVRLLLAEVLRTRKESHER